MTRRLLARPHDTAHARTLEENRRLATRVAELERERDHLVAVVDILQGIAAARNFVEILQTIARKLGEAYGLDRSSVYLADSGNVRLMATYEDPSVNNLIVDLNRYPELRQALNSGETVFIPDAAEDPMLHAVRDTLDARNVRSILVTPIRWRGATIGAIFLRTERGASAFTQEDVRFCQVIASLTATALRNAHRQESRRDARRRRREAQRAADFQRTMLMAFVRRLLEHAVAANGHDWAESLLPDSLTVKLDRLAEETLAAVGMAAPI